MTGIGIDSDSDSDSDSVLQFALDHDRIVRLAAATGAFAAAGSPVIELNGSDAPTQDDARRLGQASRPSARWSRTAAFGLQQLVDVALKALSPGIDDPTTAWPRGGCG